MTDHISSGKFLILIFIISCGHFLIKAYDTDRLQCYRESIIRAMFVSHFNTTGRKEESTSTPSSSCSKGAFLFSMQTWKFLVEACRSILLQSPCTCCRSSKAQITLQYTHCIMLQVQNIRSQVPITCEGC